MRSAAPILFMETPNAAANQDYERDSKSYEIVQDQPALLPEAGLRGDL
ncbi:hypothetical protein LNQ52_00065 [Klebsiella pneumoniae subsp. pneumoniae]|nr:hypothetical protein [Klebsiella pneumoniae subsp. pneumoniae]